MHKSLATWIGIAISAALLAFLAARFDLGAALEALRLAHVGWLFAALALYTLQFPLRGLRWSILMRSVKPVSVRSATEVFAIGVLANNVLPARLGDVARAFVLARREGVAASTTFSNVLLERVFDGLTVGGFLGAVLFVAPPDVPWVRTAATLVGMAFVGSLLVAVTVAWREALFLQLVSAFTARLPQPLGPRAQKVVEKLAKGIGTLRDPRATAQVALLSVAVWSGEVLVYAVAQHAFGLDLSILQLSLVMSILTFGLMAPSAPGFVGVYEGLVIAALGIYGVRDPIGPAFALAMHVIHFLPGTILGFAFAWRSGVKLRELREVSSSATPEPAEAA